MVPKAPIDPDIALLKIDLQMNGYNMQDDLLQNANEGIDHFIERIRHFQNEYRSLEAKGYEGQFTLRDEDPILMSQYTIFVPTEKHIEKALFDFLT